MTPGSKVSEEAGHVHEAGNENLNAIIHVLFNLSSEK
jgi:hypothetical protein